MNLDAAKAMLPEIRETLGLASDGWAPHYNTVERRSELCSRDKLSGQIEPFASFMPEASFADQRLATRARDYIEALDTLFRHACRLLVEREPEERRRAREAARGEDSRDEARDCAIRCQDRVFLRYLMEKHCITDQSDAERVAVAVRGLLSVESRTELNTNPTARQKWRDMVADFKAWRKL